MVADYLFVQPPHVLEHIGVPLPALVLLLFCGHKVRTEGAWRHQRRSARGFIVDIAAAVAAEIK